MADTTILTMAGAGTTNTASNAVAAMDIPADGFLLGAQLTIYNAADFTPVSAVHERIGAELSFISTNQFGVNDRRGALAEIRAAMILLTNGAAKMSENLMAIFGDGIKVAGGERLYVHTTASDGPVPSFTIMIMFKPGRSIGRRSARRT